MNEHKFDEKGNLIFPKPEPEKYRQDLLKKFDWKFQTNEHISWEVEKSKYDNFNSVSKEKRQEILKAWNGTGKTIGKVAEEFNVPSMVVADIIFLNLYQVDLLRKESL